MKSADVTKVALSLSIFCLRSQSNLAFFSRRRGLPSLSSFEGAGNRRYLASSTASAKEKKRALPARESRRRSSAAAPSKQKASWSPVDLFSSLNRNLSHAPAPPAQGGAGAPRGESRESEREIGETTKRERASGVEDESTPGPPPSRSKKKRKRNFKTSTSTSTTQRSPSPETKTRI